MPKYYLEGMPYDIVITHNYLGMDCSLCKQDKVTGSEYFPCSGEGKCNLMLGTKQQIQEKSYKALANAGKGRTFCQLLGSTQADLASTFFLQVTAGRATW